MGSHPSSASRPWRSSRAGAADAVHGSFLVSLRWPCDPRRHGATWRAATSWRASTGMAWPARRAAAGTVPVPRPAGGAGPAAIRAAGAALLLPSKRRHPPRAGGRAQGWLGQPGALPLEPSRFHARGWRGAGTRSSLRCDRSLRCRRVNAAATNWAPSRGKGPARACICRPGMVLVSLMVLVGRRPGVYSR
jgi:hypothetical protein